MVRHTNVEMNVMKEEVSTQLLETEGRACMPCKATGCTRASRETEGGRGKCGQESLCGFCWKARQGRASRFRID